MNQTIRTHLFNALLLCGSLVLGSGVINAAWAQYTAGNLVVTQIGDGSATPTSAANPVNLVEYTPAGSVVNTLPLPTAVAGSNRRLTVSGSASSEGILKLSADGRYLTMVGYDADVATAGVASSGSFDRVVALIDNNRSINTTTVLPQSAAYNTNNIRSAVSSDGTAIWTAGTASTNSRGGVRATTLGATDGGTQVSSTVTNIRVVGIFNSQLYVSTSSSTFLGVSSVGTGLPTSSGNTTTLVVNAGSGSNTYDFAFNSDGTVCYVADGRTTGGGVQKWTNSGGTWSLAYTLPVGGTAGAYGLAVDFSGANPVIYASTFETSSTAINRIVKLTDTGSDATASTFATAPANTVFRGIAFAPSNSQPDLTIALSAPASATLNQPFNYSLVIRNQGGVSASGISAQFTLPASTSATYNSAVGASGFTDNHSAGVVTFSGGTLAAGASTTLTVMVTPTANGTLLSGTALVDPANTITESNEANNSAAAVTTMVGSGDLPPIAPAIANQVATVGTVFSFTVPAFTDPESQTLTYAITGLSNGLSADNNTRVISGTPTAAGVQLVTIVATDPASNTISATFSLSVNAASAGVIRITEYAYNGAGNANEFIELTNVGTAPIDLTGWSFDDSNPVPGAFSIGGFGVVQPGESVIISEAPAATFRAAWYLPSTVKVVGSNNQNLGNGDEMNIFDASNNLVDKLTYPSSSTSGSTVFTNGVSAWTTQANLGTNTIGNWVLSAVNDVQNSYSSVAGNVGNPGGYFVPLNRVLVRETLNNTTVTEGGATDTYTVALNSQPTADVTITITSPGSPLTTNSPTLVFTPSNYSTVQTVIVSATDDAIVQGTRSVTITQSASSSDPAYNGITVNPVSVTIVDAPSAVPVSISAATNSAYLNVPTVGPAVVSGVINDPTDPASTIGMNFTLSAATGLTVTATSSNAGVVPDANLNLTGTGATRNLKITPIGVGYATITITATSGTTSGSYVINYAASAASTTPASTRFHTGTSDASTAVVVDASYMLVADDENQVLRLYNRQNSGLPVNGFDYTSSLALSDISGGVPREVDIEASVSSGNRIYWIGSQSNKEGGGARPNRDRVFATDVTLNGANTTLAYVSRYDHLREDIIAWDVNNGHGKGANYYDLQASADAAVDSKSSIGYNIEGAEFAPDGSTVYIGFRAPQVPLPGRPKALVIPVTNLTSILATDGGVQGSATFGAPIEFDLGGRGIREIRKNAANNYLIIAGPAGSDTGTPPNNFRLYTWTGVPTDAPALRADNLATLAVNGSFESIVEVPATLADDSQIQLLVDNGDAVYYNDATIAKDLSQNNFKKFRSDIATLGAPVKTDLSPTLILPQANFASSGSEASRNFIINLSEVSGLPTASGTIVITVTAPLGYTVSYDNSLTTIDVSGSETNPTAVDNTKWSVTDNLVDRQLTLTINSGQSILGNGITTLGFTITRTTANPGSVSNITINVKDDGSQTYDGNPLNNVYSRVINGL
ncbi:beta strand repeat-containing protein [Spirosoma arboris]|nr:lamin tail domain-containing protein [Spirosoma arboris]